MEILSTTVPVQALGYISITSEEIEGACTTQFYATSSTTAATQFYATSSTTAATPFYVASSTTAATLLTAQRSWVLKQKSAQLDEDECEAYPEVCTEEELDEFIRSCGS